MKVQQPTPGRKQVLSPIRLASTSELDVGRLIRPISLLQNWKKKMNQLQKHICKDTEELGSNKDYMNRIAECEEPIGGELMLAGHSLFWEYMMLLGLG